MKNSSSEHSRQEPPDNLDVWVGTDGLEIVSNITGEALVTVPFDEVGALIGKLSDAQGEALYTAVRDLRGEDR